MIRSISKRHTFFAGLGAGVALSAILVLLVAGESDRADLSRQGPGTGPLLPQQRGSVPG